MAARPSIALLGAILILAMVSIACSSGDDEAGASGSDPSAVPTPAYDWSEERWQVVVSLPIFADFVREMGGDQVEVHTLIPPGADPHTYVPSEEDAELVREADLVFVNGLGLDQPTIDFIEANKPAGRLFMVDFVRNIPSPTTPQPIGGKPIFAKEVGDNPHLFLDPALVPIYAETVSHSLVIIDEINEAYYDALYEAYRLELQGLHERISGDMDQIPAERRLLVTEHDSMIHWANRYGLEVAGTLEGDGGDGVEEMIEAQSLPAIFEEEGLGDGTLERIAEKTGATLCSLTTDSTSNADATYIESMQANSDAIRSCLKD